VPEGIEARIAARLERQAIAVQQDTLRSQARAMWWRGAATGAAEALLAVGCVVLLQHRVQGKPGGVRLPVRDDAGLRCPAAPGVVRIAGSG